MRKICPIMSRQVNFCNISYCEEQLCAWWDDDYDNGRCCIFTLVKNLDYVADVCDGTRTLFVKEV